MIILTTKKNKKYKNGVIFDPASYAYLNILIIRGNIEPYIYKNQNYF